MADGFFRCEAGSITVEWTVVTAALMGMGLATMDVLMPQIGQTGSDIRDHIEGDSRDITAYTAYSEDFSSGADGWSGASMSDVNGFGFVLGPIAGSEGLEAVTRNFDFDTEVSAATLSFNLLAFDNLDSEQAVLYIDGQEVGRMTSHDGVLSFEASDQDGIEINVTILASGERLGGMRNGRKSKWNDGMARVVIDIDAPGDSFRFGLGSTADQKVRNESWGLDNVEVEVEL